MEQNNEYMTFAEKVEMLKGAQSGRARVLAERVQGYAEVDVERGTGRVICRRNIRREFRAALKENHITIETAAGILGVRYQNLAKWMRGESAFPSRRVEEVLFLLDGQILKEENQVQ